MQARLCHKLGHFRHEQAEQYLLPLLRLSAVAMGRDCKLKKKRKQREKLNFMYTTGDVTHNYLACLLSPNMWFHIESGFIDYINSDCGSMVSPTQGWWVLLINRHPPPNKKRKKNKNP